MIFLDPAEIARPNPLNPNRNRVILGGSFAFRDGDGPLDNSHGGPAVSDPISDVPIDLPGVFTLPTDPPADFRASIEAMVPLLAKYCRSAAVKESVIETVALTDYDCRYIPSSIKENIRRKHVGPDPPRTRKLLADVCKAFYGDGKSTVLMHAGVGSGKTYTMVQLCAFTAIPGQPGLGGGNNVIYTAPTQAISMMVAEDFASISKKSRDESEDKQLRPRIRLFHSLYDRATASTSTAAMEEEPDGLDPETEDLPVAAGLREQSSAQQPSASSGDYDTKIVGGDIEFPVLGPAGEWRTETIRWALLVGQRYAGKDYERFIKDSEWMKKVRIFVATPDKLATSILLPVSDPVAWLGRLQLVVVDEIHQFRGIFGANTHFLLGSLLEHTRNPSSVKILMGSGTIRSAEEFAQRFTRRAEHDIAVVRSGGRSTVSAVWRQGTDPPGALHDLLVTQGAAPLLQQVETELRFRNIFLSLDVSKKKSISKIRRIISACLSRNSNAVWFRDSKSGLVGIQKVLTQDQSAMRDPPDQREIWVCHGRTGYADRRAIENRASLVTSAGATFLCTSVFETGVNIASCNFAILDGLPNDTDAAGQRAGRTGRKEFVPGLCIMLVEDAESPTGLLALNGLERLITDQGGPHWTLPTEVPLIFAKGLALALAQAHIGGGKVKEHWSGTETNRSLFFTAPNNAFADVLGSTLRTVSDRLDGLRKACETFHASFFGSMTTEDFAGWALSGLRSFNAASAWESKTIPVRIITSGPPGSDGQPGALIRTTISTPTLLDVYSSYRIDDVVNDGNKNPCRIINAVLQRERIAADMAASLTANPAANRAELLASISTSLSSIRELVAERVDPRTPVTSFRKCEWTYLRADSVPMPQFVDEFAAVHRITLSKVEYVYSPKSTAYMPRHGDIRIWTEPRRTSLRLLKRMRIESGVSDPLVDVLNRTLRWMVSASVLLGNESTTERADHDATPTDGLVVEVHETREGINLQIEDTTNGSLMSEIFRRLDSCLPGEVESWRNLGADIGLPRDYVLRMHVRKSIAESKEDIEEHALFHAVLNVLTTNNDLQ